jgi:putative nucleotidyltransferase with HDIG domain
MFVIALAGIGGIASVSPATSVLTTARALTVLQAQGFFIVAGVTGLALSAAMLDNRRLAADAIETASGLQASKDRLELLVEEVVGTLGKVVETRDPYTQGHEMGVARVSRLIAEGMGLSEDEVRVIEMGALVHDIGKLSVPAEILSKPGSLSDAEFRLIKGHAQAGYDILKDIDFGSPIAEIALQHHERMDGSGYPNHLYADEILMASRIVAVADVIEAMSSHRPYRPALSLEAAMAEIHDHPEKYDEKVRSVCLGLFKTGQLKL